LRSRERTSRRGWLEKGKGVCGSDVVVVVVKEEVSGEVGLRPRGMAGRNGERYAYTSERWDGTLDDTALACTGRNETTRTSIATMFQWRDSYCHSTSLEVDFFVSCFFVAAPFS